MDPDKNYAGAGEIAKLVYGEMGRYARIIDPFPRAKAPTRSRPPLGSTRPPRSRSPLPEGHRWAKSTDFTGPLAVIGRARARFGQGVATFDADGDGRLDLYLTSAVVGPKGVHDVLLLNRGDGKFEDASAAFGLPDDRVSLGVAAADFDADNRVDLFLTGVGDNRLYRNLGGRFEDVTKVAGMADGPPSISLSARWLDLDQDGDLDLYVLNYSGRGTPTAPSPTSPPAGLAELGLPERRQARAGLRHDPRITGPRWRWPRPTSWPPKGSRSPSRLPSRGSRL